MERLGVEAVVIDDLASYKPVVDKLGLGHQICVTHVRKNAAKRLRKVKGWQEWKRRVRYQQCNRQVIGKSKIRHKTMRNYKVMEGMVNGLWLTQWIWGESRMDLGELLAA